MGGQEKVLTTEPAFEHQTPWSVLHGGFSVPYASNQQQEAMYENETVLHLGCQGPGFLKRNTNRYWLLSSDGSRCRRSLAFVLLTHTARAAFSAHWLGITDPAQGPHLQIPVFPLTVIRAPESWGKDLKHEEHRLCDPGSFHHLPVPVSSSIKWWQ